MMHPLLTSSLPVSVNVIDERSVSLAQLHQETALAYVSGFTLAMALCVGAMLAAAIIQLVFTVRAQSGAAHLQKGI